MHIRVFHHVYFRSFLFCFLFLFFYFFFFPYLETIYPSIFSKIFISFVSRDQTDLALIHDRFDFPFFIYQFYSSYILSSFFVRIIDYEKDRDGFPRRSILSKKYFARYYFDLLGFDGRKPEKKYRCKFQIYYDTTTRLI